MKELPKHLGGHGNKNHVDDGALEFLKERFDIKSLLDIGCGLGKMKGICDSNSVSYLGIDGDWSIKREHDQVMIHDYTTGPAILDDKRFDLGWSTEFLEHVEAAYVENFMADFSRCRYAMVTHAMPGKKGHHHVNCKKPEYWKNIFYDHGFRFLEDDTKILRKRSTMEREFVRNQALVFERKEYIQ
jgi:cyclopropane fatty-acyl-phospholipid synthase-like methyltransferase